MYALVCVATLYHMSSSSCHATHTIYVYIGAHTPSLSPPILSPSPYLSPPTLSTLPSPSLSPLPPYLCLTPPALSFHPSLTYTFTF